MATITNVIKWVTNQEEFRQNVQSGVDQIVAMEKAVERTTRSLQGEGLIRAAHNAAAAVEQMGGAVKLTAAEKERLNRLVEKAIEKYQALGQTAPSALHALAEATRASQGPMEKLSDHAAMVQRNVDSFSGDKIIQEAHAMATAVEQLGGASNLTAAEQAKVNTVVQEALAKYKTLGETAPATLRELAAATTPITREMSSLNDHVTRVTALTRRFAGEDVIRNAHEYAKAVQQVGGASKLTASEQTAVNAVVQEAIAKYKALGETAPAALVELEQATRQMQPATESWYSSFAKMTASMFTAQALWDLTKMGITAVVDVVKAGARAVADMVNDAADLGDELFALSMKTGITVEALSELRFVASQGNTDLQSVTNSIFKMQVQLAEGGKDTRQALKLLHLDINALRGQRPEEAYLNILAALGQVPTHADRAALGMRLFGKGFKETAQLAREDIKGLIAEAQRLGLVMTTEAAIAGDRYGDMLDKATKKTDALRMAVGSALLPVLIAVGEALIDGFVAAITASGTSAGAFQLRVEELAVRTVKAFAVIMEWGAQLANLLVKVFATNYFGPFLLQIGTVSGLLQDMLVPLAMMPGAVGDAARVAMVQLEKVQQTALTGLTLTASAVQGVDAASKAAVSAAQHLGREFEQTYARVKAEIADAAKKARESNAALGESFGSLKAGEAVTDSLIKKMAELATKIQMAERAGTPFLEIVTLYGKEAAAVAIEVTALGLTTEASVARIANAWRSAQLAEILKAVSTAAAKAVQEMAAASEKAGKAGLRAFEADLLAQLTAQKEFGEKNYQLTLQGTALRARQIELAYASELAKLKEKHGAETAAYRLAKAEIDAYYDHLDQLNIEQGFIDSAKAVQAFGQAIAEVGAVIGDNFFGRMVSGLGNLVAGWGRAREAAIAYARASADAQRMMIAQAALAGAAGVIGSTASGTTQQRAMGGAIAGAQAGMAIGFMVGGPVGAAVGAVIGGVGGLVVGLVRGGLALTEYQKRVRAAAEEMQKLRTEIRGLDGGLATLRERAHVVGIAIDTAFNSNDPEFLKRTLADLDERTERLNAAMERYGLSWLELGETVRKLHVEDLARELLKDFQALTTAGAAPARAIEGMAGALNGLIRDALRAGVQIPANMRPIIEQLIRMGLLTEENRRLMLGLADSSMPALADIEAAAGRYGLTLDQLGPKVAQLRIDETAQQIVDDFNLLILAGADVATVLGGMAPKIQDLVSQALRFGLELPASMRPLIQQMIELGLLTDQNGNRLTDLAGLNFAEPLEASVDRLILKLDELISVLTNGVGGALDDLGRRQVRIPVRFDIDNLPEVPGGQLPVATAATGGLVTSASILPFAKGGAVPKINYFDGGGEVGRLIPFIPRGTDTVPAMLTPGEIVLTAAQQRRVAGALSDQPTSSEPRTVVFNATFNLNTPIAEVDTIRKFIDEECAPRLVQLWEKGGALTRKTRDALKVA